MLNLLTWIRVCIIRLPLFFKIMPQIVHFQLSSCDALCDWSSDSSTIIPHIGHWGFEVAGTTLSESFEVNCEPSALPAISWTRRVCERNSIWFGNISWQTPHLLALCILIRWFSSSFWVENLAGQSSQCSVPFSRDLFDSSSSLSVVVTRSVSISVKTLSSSTRNSGPRLFRKKVNKWIIQISAKRWITLLFKWFTP